MTDYSSNESSNENDYEEFIKHEEEPILSQNFKTISNISIASQSSIGSSYQPSKLMFSPKKDKSKVKRMYMNKKRIPRWAADL